jgi:hypothetical protein
MDFGGAHNPCRQRLLFWMSSVSYSSIVEDAGTSPLRAVGVCSLSSRLISFVNPVYLDHSDDVSDPSQRCLLAGADAIACQGYWLSEDLTKIAARFDNANAESIELHGSPMPQDTIGGSGGAVRRDRCRIDHLPHHPCPRSNWDTTRS